jgi:peptide/nickel transport system ATP-binding protein
MPSEGLTFEASGLTRIYQRGKQKIAAVDDVSFEIGERQLVSIVGQSGSGKSVLGKLLLRLETPTAGSLYYRGRPIGSEKDLRVHWRSVQAVFQDPFSAFNQFFTIRAQLRSCFRLWPKQPSRQEMEEKVDQALGAVNIQSREIEGKYPFELSGGQMQRMLLARVFILRPSVLIADEPTSMVDACSRATILDYLMKLRRELEMTIVLVTHDIGLAYYASDSILIMHQGRIVERGNPDQVTLSPRSEITRQLLDDIPAVNRDWIGRRPAQRER